MKQRINVSRQVISYCTQENVESFGGSYTHLTSLKGIVGPDTRRIVVYHAFLTSLEGLEDSKEIQHAYLGFNRIFCFRSIDLCIPRIQVLDLAGNPLESLENCPPCHELIVSATRITNLQGCPKGVEIIRCGHSTFLQSLQGCPTSVKLIECSCAPNLKIEQVHLPKQLRELLTDQKLRSLL